MPPAGTLTRAPELLTFVEATYPPDALAEGRTGEVVLRVTLDAEGVPVEIEVDQPAGHGFDEAAIEAVARFGFRPAEVDGEPAAVQILYTYAFTLEQEVTTVQAPIDAERPTGALSGRVLERGTRRPLPGVAVRVAGIEEEVFTDAAGGFQVSVVPAGAVLITLDDPEFYTLEDEEEIVAGQETEVRYYLERRGADAAMLVVGRRVKKEVARRSLTVEEIRKIPGTQGDALKVVQNLPGVARIPFGGGGLIVRGSNPGDSGSVINRHFIPLVFHFGGLRSVFPSELLESIDFYPGNFGPEYGRFTGGVVDVQVKRPRGDGYHGRAEADVFDAGLLLEGPVGQNGTFALAGRRSYIDVILPAVLPEDANIDFTVAPRYYDYQALYDWQSGDHRVRLYFFGSDDKLQFVLDEPIDGEPDLRGNFKTQTAFYRLYAAWNTRISSDLDHEVSVSVGQNKLFFAGGTDLEFDNNVTVITLRDDVSWRLSDAFRLRGGADVEAFIGDLSINAPLPPKEGQQGGAPLSTRERIRAERDFFFLSPSLWVEGEWRLGALTLLPGLRVDYDYVLDDTALDPRLTTRYALREGTVLKAGVGQYSQRPSPDEVDREFGNPSLNLEHSLHLAAGVEQRITEDVELDLQGFYKALYDSVAPVDDPERRYDNNGRGRIYGLEVLLRHALRERFFGWISYTLMRSERWDAQGRRYRLFDFDQTHILTTIAQYKLSNTWEIGARWRYVTGNPQTPRQGAVYDADADVYVGLQGPVNSRRLEPFHQLDIRVDRRWVMDTWMFTAYLEIQNAYNRANPENILYSYDFSQNDRVTGLPIIPSLGLRGEF